MTVTEALNFIHSVSWRGSVPGLDRTRELMARLGDPQSGLRFIHIAGTNGKGSVAAMLSSILDAAGLRVGLYTSPYINRFHERMQICGVPISDEELAEITAQVAPHASAMADSPTEFELVTAIALLWFARRGCDYVVLETGLGGRLDSTNIIDTPACSVITNIGLDHTQVLGSTLPEIAREKAGIIKPDGQVVLYQQSPEVTQVIEEVCQSRNAQLTSTDFSALNPLTDDLDGQRFLYGSAGPYRLPLLGPHQLLNAAVVLEVVNVLRRQGVPIQEKAVVKGFGATRWPARFELIDRSPCFVVDGGHNPQCAETVALSLEQYFPDCRRVLLMGVMADKDLEGVMSHLDPLADVYVTVAPDNPRAMPARELGERLARFGKPVTVCASIPEAVAAAQQAAGADGMVCAVGSLYMAGAIRGCFGLN